MFNKMRRVVGRSRTLRKVRRLFSSSSGDTKDVSPHRASWAELLDEVDEKGEQVAEVLRLMLRDAPSLEQKDQWKLEVQALADRIPPQYLTHHLLRRMERHQIRVQKGVSFCQYMVKDSEIRKMKINSLGWWLNRKTTAYRFVDALGVRRPGAELSPSRFSKVNWQYPGVLKAVSGTGGRGVYLLFAEDEVVHVLDGQKFSSQKEVDHHARNLMSPDSRRPLRNRWIMEELILESQKLRTPARDLKFYCFYGEVLLVLEVIRQGDQSLYSFTLPDGSYVRPGEWDYLYFDGAGATAKSLELASRISREIPHPFMRIDLLSGEDELVFGEFTPRPGGFQDFDCEWDRRMGEAWLRAEDRLQRDLLLGKRFDKFLSSTNIFL